MRTRIHDPLDGLWTTTAGPVRRGVQWRRVRRVSIGAESLLGAQLDRDGHAHQPEGSNGRSDYAPFVDAGIASTGLLSIRDDNYHTPQDDIDNVSITTLTHTARAVANLIGTLQQDADALGTR